MDHLDVEVEVPEKSCIHTDSFYISCLGGYLDLVYASLRSL